MRETLPIPGAPVAPAGLKIVCLVSAGAVAMGSLLDSVSEAPTQMDYENHF